MNDDQKTELDNDDQDVDVSTCIPDLFDQLNNEPIQCKYCHRFGHNELKCFDLHPCSFCGKTNHLSIRCQKNKKIQWKLVLFEWLGTWCWC